MHRTWLVYRRKHQIPPEREQIVMNQPEELIFSVTSSVYDEIQDLNNGTYLHPIIASLDTAETSGNNTGPDIPDSECYEKIVLPDVDNGTYIHPCSAMPDMPETSLKEVYTRPVMFESAQYEKIANRDDNGLNAMPDTSETAVKEVYTKPAIDIALSSS